MTLKTFVASKSSIFQNEGSEVNRPEVMAEQEVRRAPLITLEVGSAMKATVAFIVHCLHEKMRRSEN